MKTPEEMLEDLELADEDRIVNDYIMELIEPDPWGLTVDDLWTQAEQDAMADRIADAQENRRWEQMP